MHVSGNFSIAFLLLSRAGLAAVLKEGTACTVTPLSATPAATRSQYARREILPEEADGILTGPGSPETYPRPEPGREPGPGEPERYPRVEPGKPVAAHGRHPRDIAELELVENEDDIDAASPVDDTPQIIDAFKQCGHDGSIVFTEGTYHLRQVLNTTDLRNCTVSILGTWVWSTDNIQYWLSHSFPVVYAGRSTAWLLGGQDVQLLGHGRALFDGGGQVWIDQNRSGSNQNGRPISLTVWHGTNIVVDGITWRQAQFWHTFVAHSTNVTMTNLDMNTTSHSQWSAVNTDGTDTWNSKDVVIANWTVTCGDDCIAVKGNSTNVHISNVTCHESGGMTVGSIGSQAGQPDYVDDVVFEDIDLHHSSNAAWIKTYPSGSGHVRNVTFRNVHFENVNQPIYVTSCIYSGQNCDSARLRISDVRWENITGTSRYNVAAGIHCSSAAPCQNLTFEGIDIKPMAGGTAKVLCSNIQNQASSGLQCTGSCPGNWPQQLSGNR